MQKLFIFIALITSLQACAQPNEQTNNPTQSPQQTANQDISKMEAQQLLQNIEAMIADKSCQQVSDCDLLPVGARPCGGPDSYLPYAPNKVSDPKVLSALNQAYKKKIQDYFAENQIMGICVATPKPSVACQQNQCVALEQNLQIQ